MYTSKYLTQVLGLKYFIRPESKAEPKEWVFELSPQDLSMVKIGFLSLADQAESLFSKQNFELFEKMRQAMKLDKSTTLVVEGPQTKRELLKLLKQYRLPIWVILGTSPDISFPEHQVISYKDQKLLQTFHPQFLNIDVELKKLSWQDLKLVMSEVM